LFRESEQPENLVYDPLTTEEHHPCIGTKEKIDPHGEYDQKKKRIFPFPSNPGYDESCRISQYKTYQGRFHGQYHRPIQNLHIDRFKEPAIISK